MESQTKILEPLRYHTFSLCVEHEVSKQESPVTSSTDEVEEGIRIVTHITGSLRNQTMKGLLSLTF